MLKYPELKHLKYGTDGSNNTLIGRKISDKVALKDIGEERAIEIKTIC